MPSRLRIAKIGKKIVPHKHPSHSIKNIMRSRVKWVAAKAIFGTKVAQKVATMYASPIPKTVKTS